MNNTKHVLNLTKTKILQTDVNMRKTKVIVLISIFLVTPFFTLAQTVNAQESNVTFVFGSRENLWRVDPISASGTIANFWFPNWMHEPLYHMENWDPSDPSLGYVVPWLVESETICRDGIAINLTLRDGIKFWNGMPFNASALQWNMHRLRDIGTTNYGEASPASTLNRFWYEIDAFLSIPENLKYNDSSLYPELWWNKDWSRYPPEYYDGTNQSRIMDPYWNPTYTGGPDWPGDIATNWTGRSVWNAEEIWDIYTNTRKDLSGNYPGNNRNTNSFNNITLDPNDHLKCTVWLSLPVWDDMKEKALWAVGMIWPYNATFNPSTQEFATDSPLYKPGAHANPDFQTSPYLSVKGPYYDAEVGLDGWDKCIGTGPFKQTDYIAVDKTMVFENFTEYWGGNWAGTGHSGPITPAMDTFVFKVYDADEPFFTAFLDGELDYIDFGSSSYTDYEDQINSEESTRLVGPYDADGYSCFYMNPNPAGSGGGTWPPEGTDTLDYTLRYAISFAFQYDHYLQPSIMGSVQDRNLGPLWGDRLYTDYVNNTWHPTFPRQSKPGFFFNLTEARWLLLNNDSLGRAAAAGLTMDDIDDDVAWQTVSGDHDKWIANITLSDHASFPEWFINVKSYLSLIGINVEKWENRPIPTSEWFPYETTQNRWSKHMWRMDFYYTSPNLFDPVKWHFDDVLGVSNLSNPADHTGVWNSWPYYSSQYKVSGDWAERAGYSGYTPTDESVWRLIHQLPFIQNETQKMLDYGSIMDKVYTDAIAIWVGQPKGYAGISRYWDFGDRKDSGLGGAPFWDFRQTGWTPQIIPGFPTALLIAFTLLAVMSIAIVVKKREILVRK